MPCSMDQASSPRASSAPTPICTTTTTVSLCKHRSTVIVSWQILTVAHGACLRTHRPTVASCWGLHDMHICQFWVVAAIRAGGALDCTLNYKCVARNHTAGMYDVLLPASQLQITATARTHGHQSNAITCSLLMSQLHAGERHTDSSFTATDTYSRSHTCMRVNRLIEELSHAKRH